MQEAWLRGWQCQPLEISQQHLAGLPGNLVQTFMFPKDDLTFVIPYIFHQHHLTIIKLKF